MLDLPAERGVPARLAASAEEDAAAALETAGRTGTVCALASLYLCGEIRSLVGALRPDGEGFFSRRSFLEHEKQACFYDEAA